MVRSIKQAEIILKVISENISDLIVVTDIRRKRISANSAYEKLYQSPAAYIGSDFLRDIHTEDMENVKLKFQEVVTSGFTGIFSYRLQLPDGAIRLFESKIIQLLDEMENPRNLIVISRDVTELLQSQKEIRLLAHAVSCTKDAFILTDLSNNFLFINPAACEMYGYVEEELLGKSINVIHSTKNSVQTLRQIQQATLDGGWNGEIFQRRKDETEFLAELWTSVVHDETGKPVAINIIARDISERKQTEEKLYETAERLKLTLDNLDIIAYELDATGKFLLSRGRGLEKVSLSPDEVVGVSAFDVFKNNENIIKMLTSAYKGEGGEADVDVGGVIWNANFIPMKNADGVVERVFATAIDITERKRAEERLSYESELWHTLMDNIPDTIYFKDIHSRFIRINKAQCIVLGIQNSDDAIGKTDADFFVDEHAKKSLLDEQRILDTGTPMLGDVEKVTTRDGRVIWFSTTKVPMRDKMGEIIGIIGSSRDVTEIKQAEALESALYRITEETSSSEDLSRLYIAIHGIISELMYARNFFIALYDNEKDLLSFPYFVDEVDVPPEPGTAGKGFTAYVLRKGKSLLCDQKVSDELERKGEAELVGVPSPIWLGVPLVIEGKTIGAMVVQHYSDPHAYGFREQHILEFVSTQVAKAIERKRAAETLKKSEEQYRAFIGQSSEGIWRFDTDVPISISLPEEEQIQRAFEYFYLAECNDAMAQMYGFKNASEIIGLRLKDMLVPNDSRNHDMIMNFIRSDYRLAQVESREFDRNGKVKIFSNNLVGIREDNTLCGLWGTQIDVTERRQAEEMLIQSEEKYRTLFEDSHDCIILSTPEGKLLDINPSGVELFGYSSKDQLLQVGNACELYFDPNDREVFTRHLEQFKFVRDLEIAIKRKDGQKRFVLENSSAVRSMEGNIVAYRSFLRDITERKNLEDQLRQAQKLESIGTLAGGIAHEFNNILGIILGYASILESKALDQNRLVQGVDTIKKAVQRGAELVRQLLTFARKGETTFGAVNVNETVSELVEMLKQTFPKTITIQSDTEESIPFIEADSSQLHLALLNLCVNARDAIAEKKSVDSGEGVLTIKTRVLKNEIIQNKFSDALDSKYIVISVKDTGIGMDEETKSRMFEPFFTTKELGKGTGLGLSVVYGVVNSHHGFVEVESAPGLGTTFSLYFPAAERMVVTSDIPEVMEKRIGKGNETILIVEDEQMLGNLLQSILEDQGYHVITAKDGQEGFELYEQQKDQIDLVLSDMGLPRLGGYEMFMKMKEVKPSIKAILASGYFEPNLKVELVNAGAKDFIQKPYVPEVIIQRIREVLDEQ